MMTKADTTINVGQKQAYGGPTRNTPTGPTSGIGGPKAQAPPYIQEQQGPEKCLVLYALCHWRGTCLLLQE